MWSTVDKKVPPASVDQSDSKTVNNLSVKQKVGDTANRWLEKNRSLVLRQTPVWAQSLALITIGLGSIAVIGGIFFRIDEVISVQGQLKTIGGTVEVQSPVGGLVSQVLFKDGQKVQKGQLLIKFDTRKASDQRNTLERLIKYEGERLASEVKSLDSQMSSLESRQLVLSQRVKTKETITSEMRELVSQGGFQRVQYLEQMDQLLSLKQQLEDQREQYSRLNLQKEQIKINSKKSIGQMQVELNNAELQLQYQTIKAPVSGVVFDPAARPDSVFRPGERILSIVPQDGLFAEVYVPNKDIGFVKTGQQTKVRVDAFPFTRYGEIVGNVEQISADAQQPSQEKPYYNFPVKLNLETSYLETKDIKIPLKAGMAITANLKLRDKRVISLISDLLVDQTDSVRSIRQQ